MITPLHAQIYASVSSDTPLNPFKVLSGGTICNDYKQILSLLRSNIFNSSCEKIISFGWIGIRTFHHFDGFELKLALRT